jgi:beta-glucanase (GH16 family)
LVAAVKGRKNEKFFWGFRGKAFLMLIRRILVLASMLAFLGCSDPQAAPGDGGGGGSFSLVFRDDFDALDPSRWQLMTHSWSTNLALFSAQAASIEGGALAIRLLPAPEGTADNGAAKQFLGAEVRSRATLTYGRVRARIKFARGSAVVSSLVTIYTPWPADNWNELDVECLGSAPEALEYNAQVYTGPPTTPPVTTPVSPTPDVHEDPLPFDPSADFHVYTIEWTPAGAKFLVDDELRHTWTENIALMTLPQNVLLTIWASSSVAWAGAVDETTTGATATYDWVELYDYSPP